VLTYDRNGLARELDPPPPFGTAITAAAIVARHRQ
jgi:hypothetical protein